MKKNDWYISSYFRIVALVKKQLFRVAHLHFEIKSIPIFDEFEYCVIDLFNFLFKIKNLLKLESELAYLFWKISLYYLGMRLRRRAETRSFSVTFIFTITIVLISQFLRSDFKQKFAASHYSYQISFILLKSYSGKLNTMVPYHWNGTFRA